MQTVTKLEYQKNNKERVNVYLDGSFFAGMSLENVIKFSLKEGKEVDEQKLKELLFEENKQKAFQKSTDLISKFVKTEKQIKDYLKEKSFDEQVIFETVDKLKEYGFINDQAYVESYVGFKKNVCGAKKIKQELFAKGISKKLIDRVDELLGEEGTSACESIAEKYMKNKEKTFENKVKLNRYLLSKGFDYADINKVISKIIKDGDDEGWN